MLYKTRYLLIEVVYMAQTQKNIQVQAITKDMTLGDVIQKYPRAAVIMTEKGLHCVGCGVSHWETIEQGAKGHGMSDQQVQDIIDTLNEQIGKQEVSGHDLNLTKEAASKIKELLHTQKKESYGLRIAVVPGGCSGHMYQFQFEQKEHEGDQVIEEQGVKLFVDTTSLSFLKGSVVDFIDGLQGAGFKISNPNSHASCGCGQSFH